MSLLNTESKEMRKYNCNGEKQNGKKKKTVFSLSESWMRKKSGRRDGGY